MKEKDKIGIDSLFLLFIEKSEKKHDFLQI